MIKTELAEAYVTIKGRLSPFQKDLAATQKKVNLSVASMQKTMDKYSASIKRIGRQMTIMGGAMTAAFTGIIYKTTEMGDEMDKMSKRTGLAVEYLSKMQYAAQITGTNMGAFERSVRYLSRAMDDVSKGIGESRASFEKMGITVIDEAGNLRGVESVLLDVADRINKLGSETEKTAAITDLFGSRAGTELLPLMRLGSKGVKDLTDRAEELGLVMSTQAAAAAAEFKDRMTELKTSLSFAVMEIGNALLPVLKPLVERLTEVIGQVTAWTKEHPQLTAALAKFGLVLAPMMATGGILAMLAPTLVKITAAVKALTVAIGVSGLAGALSTVGTVLLPLVGAGGAFYLIHKQIIETDKTLKSMAINSLVKQLQSASISTDIFKQELATLGITAENAAQYGLARFFVDAKKLKQGLEAALGSIETSTASTRYFANALEALFSPFDIVGRKIQQMASDFQNLRKAQKAAMGFLPEAPPAAMPRVAPRPHIITGGELIVEANRTAVEKLRSIWEGWLQEWERISGLGVRIAEGAAHEKVRIGESTAEKLAAATQEWYEFERRVWYNLPKEVDEGWKEIEDTVTTRSQTIYNTWTNLTDNISYAISDMYADFISGMSTPKEAWEQFCADLRRIFRDTVSQILGDWISTQIKMAAIKTAGTAGGTAAGVGAAGVGGAALAGAVAFPFIAVKSMQAVGEVFGGIKDLFFQGGGVVPGRLQPNMQGMFRRPVMAHIAEGPPGEAVVPLTRGGRKIPVELRGQPAGSITIGPVNINLPHTDLRNLSRAEVSAIVNRQIVSALRDSAKTGLLNPVVMT